MNKYLEGLKRKQDASKKIVDKEMNNFQSFVRDVLDLWDNSKKMKAIAKLNTCEKLKSYVIRHKLPYSALIDQLRHTSR